MIYSLDTDTLIYLVNGAPDVAARVAALGYRDLCVSTMTAMEIFTGFEKMPGQTVRVDRFNRLLSQVNVLPFDLADARATAKVRAILEKSGQKIGAYDLQIAGQALHRGLTLVTHNIRHFQRVPGLVVEDWMG
jgi:tRNA(fMet)-specific endonuclease VapC